MATLLVITIFSPVVGAAACWALSEAGVKVVRATALVSSLITLALAGFCISEYLAAGGGTVDYGLGWNWLGTSQSGLDIRFAVGLDGLSVWLFGLTALLMLPAVLVSWDAINDRAGAFYALMLLLETGSMGVFAAQDIILFYIFFEFTLIPIFFLIGVWGHEDRRFAAIKFFLYTLFGSVISFLGLLAIVMWVYYHSEPRLMTFSIPELTSQLAQHPIDPDTQFWIFLALFAGFAIKVPLFPLHTWLPLAHVQAPTAGSVELAGVLLKIGAYGFFRFSLPMLPNAAAVAMPWIMWLSVAGVIYGALVALVQTDMKKLIAYSSVSHLGFCMLGLFSLNRLGVQGGVLQLVSHGISTGGLFAIVGMLYERYHTRQISDLGGLARRTPLLAFFMVLFTMSSIGLPGLNGFAGEFLLLIGMFQRAWTDAPVQIEFHLKLMSVLALTGVVLGAWYMLWLVKRVFFGPLHEGGHHGSHQGPIRDMSLHEIAALAPLALFVFWIGLYPKFFLDPMATTLDDLAAPAQRAMRAEDPLPVAETPARRESVREEVARAH
ncbi:MAG: NADH-quinone oxidoreductase subunit M [Pirellulales bacterium]|nr:NADH-quinone oxidoreductase subunit M [Pirellulales bacterium]